jgi:hypothetical protein
MVSDNQNHRHNIGKIFENSVLFSKVILGNKICRKLIFVKKVLSPQKSLGQKRHRDEPRWDKRDNCIGISPIFLGSK